MRYGREHAYKNSNKLLLRLGLENKKDLEHYYEVYVHDWLCQNYLSWCKRVNTRLTAN